MKINYHKTLFFAASVMLANTVNLNAQSTATGNKYEAGRFLGWGTTSGNLEFRVNNTVKMLMENNTGDVGIGINTPSAKLHVNGWALYSYPGNPSSAAVIRSNSMHTDF